MESKKSLKANLEKKRMGFLFIGLVFALSVALTAFEYTTYSTSEYNVCALPSGSFTIIPQEIVPIAIAEKPLPPLPKPKPSNQFIISDIDPPIPTEPVAPIWEPIAPVSGPVPAVIPEVVPEDTIWEVVESMPEYPGGVTALFKYLGANIKYPIKAREAGISGVVFVNFIVEEDGSISNAKVLRNVGGGCDEEALRVVNKMQNWKPGEQRGRKVKVSFNIPVRFTLE